MEKIIFFFEKKGFDVCSRISDKFGIIQTSHVRLFFIYLSFATVGGGYFIYLLIAFLFKVKDKFFVKRKSVFDI
ncbi:PspC family transcriptional regulator [Ichthyobacterium seriolicida]|uniref:PspC family transcriptional regulator n=1 Tax=Ichthyobacterium seriolicida TaxID=242600 RepID=A0A1J1EB64_9FLAO|nr:PspC family transcriptional regulator [Ichthyobacterium seriolicida]BAV95179.1 PspC family transcriptional regulator [Ichthyobacterium seriolicida]